MMFHRTPPGRRLLSRLPSLVALLCGVAPIPAAAELVTLRIDPGQRFQNIRGFGASGAWWTNYVAKFPEEDRRRILRLLFTKDGAA
jgi:O-glycosyl hydrolase